MSEHLIGICILFPNPQFILIIMLEIIYRSMTEMTEKLRLQRNIPTVSMAFIMKKCSSYFSLIMIFPKSLASYLVDPILTGYLESHAICTISGSRSFSSRSSHSGCGPPTKIYYHIVFGHFN